MGAFILFMFLFICGVYYSEYEDELLETLTTLTMKDILKNVIIIIVIGTISYILFG